MSRPEPAYNPTADIVVTRGLPMRADGIFYTIHPFEPCVSHSITVNVTYALEFGGMPESGAMNFARGHDEATIPPVLRREICSIATDESHSAAAWLQILRRRSEEGYAMPKRLMLSQSGPVPVSEFGRFVGELGSEIEELRIGVDLANPPVAPIEFLKTFDWTALGSIKVLRLGLLLPPPPDAKKNFGPRPRLDSGAKETSIPAAVLEDTLPPATRDAPSDHTSPRDRDSTHLGARKRISRPVSGLFKGISAFAKGALGKDPKPRPTSLHLVPDIKPTQPPLPPPKEASPPSANEHRRSATTFSNLPDSPTSEESAYSDDTDPTPKYSDDTDPTPKYSDDTNLTVKYADDSSITPNVPFPTTAQASLLPPDLPLAELRLSLQIRLPEWAKYENGGDDWGYLRASVPHPAQLARELTRFGAGCSAYVKVESVEPVEGVDEISADYDLRVVGRLADAWGRYGPFASDEERDMYVKQ